MIPQEAYYIEGSEVKVLKAIRNPKLKNILQTNYKFKSLWKYVTNEQDIIDLTYFFMAKARQWKGCIGESIANESIEYIMEYRNAKLDELGVYYK